MNLRDNFNIQEENKKEDEKRIKKNLSLENSNEKEEDNSPKTPKPEKTRLIIQSLMPPITPQRNYFDLFQKEHAWKLNNSCFFQVNSPFLKKSFVEDMRNYEFSNIMNLNQNNIQSTPKKKKRPFPQRRESPDLKNTQSEKLDTCNEEMPKRRGNEEFVVKFRSFRAKGVEKMKYIRTFPSVVTKGRGYCSLVYPPYKDDFNFIWKVMFFDDYDELAYIHDEENVIIVSREKIDHNMHEEYLSKHSNHYFFKIIFPTVTSKMKDSKNFYTKTKLSLFNDENEVWRSENYFKVSSVRTQKEINHWKNIPKEKKTKDLTGSKRKR